MKLIRIHFSLEFLRLLTFTGNTFELFVCIEEEKAFRPKILVQYECVAT